LPCLTDNDTKQSRECSNYRNPYGGHHLIIRVYAYRSTATLSSR
jgi:hypothetical protein